ncbi:MAG: type II toxin-antitoxin system VapC family toxin [Lamprobacter sp.]|uniref:type II toxin-antitoxin system VapC family toxin n=1 Tax=Lamprobacter sp. TaxID=3100796 RepID=UPI002B257A9E|nr:type II toxin-antitoxin system VapC family toxin [Lamprobacter sp.]MEA3643328.1 type II toxin-antitoxin system VapC family toxin [Lamprobacter sp.]
MKPLVYVETSIVSYLTARPSRDVVTAARQVWTREWWDQADQYWVRAISELVIDEAAKGDPVAARRRLDVVRNIDILRINPDCERLAQQMIEAGALPATEAEDALHVALASYHGARYLLSWNFAHLVGPEQKARLIKTLDSLGQTPALLTTPEELLEGIIR